MSFGQDSYEAHLADAVTAQSLGNIPSAIASYQSALAIRRDVPEVWANLGLMQHQVQDYSGALKSFKTANQLQPNLFVPILFLGIENLQLGDRPAAVRYLSAAQHLHANDPEIYMNLGRAYFGLRQFDNAASSYRRAAELNPQSGEAWYRLGITYLEMSEASSGELAKLNRGSPFFQRLNADTLSEQGKLVEATEIYAKLLTDRSFPPCTQASYGLVLLLQRKRVEAQMQLQEASTIGGCSLAQIGLIRISIEKGDVNGALTMLKALWDRDQGFVRGYISALTEGMTTEQISALDLALTQSDSSSFSPDAMSTLRLSLRGGRTLSIREVATGEQAHGKITTAESAQKLYRRGEYGRCTNDLLPGTGSLSTDKLSLLAACSFLTGDFTATVAAAKRLRMGPQTAEAGLYWSIVAEQQLAILALAYAGEVEPNSIRLHELLAESYRDRAKYTEAEAEYKIALGINPNEFSALVGAAANYLQESRVDLSHEMIQRALSQHPSDAETNYIMGEVLMAEHKYTDAEPYLRIGLNAKADLTPRIHALLGQVYASEGDTKRSIDEYKLGLPADDDGSIHFQLGKVYQRAGETSLAAEAFAASKALVQQRQTTARNDFSRVHGDSTHHP
jgi:tetratricopeptide (TPR) repeat protein